MDALTFNIQAKQPFICHYQGNFPAQGIHFLWGASGAGKSTLLHMLAGLTPCNGDIVCAQNTWQSALENLPPQQRDIGMVFQRDTLFPFLSVHDNLLFGYRNAPNKRFTPQAVIQSLILQPLLDKKIRDLSGGERQRVQLGRALLNQPRWLFLDEAFAALDEHSRQQMFTLLRSISNEYSIPVLMISHQWQEVLQLADYIHVIENGRITSSATFSDAIATQLPIHSTQGGYSVLQFTDLQWQAETGLYRANVAGHGIFLPQVHTGASRLVIQARDVALALTKPQHTSVLNAWPVIISHIEILSEYQVSVQLDFAGQKIMSQISRYSCTTLGLTVGMPVFALVKGVALLR
jgi:molybdate transport system ATP-binding protein